MIERNRRWVFIMIGVQSGSVVICSLSAAVRSDDFEFLSWPITTVTLPTSYINLSR